MVFLGCGYEAQPRRETMLAMENQSHVKWYCRYHIVIVPKYQKEDAIWER